jgi:hypothetical protein
MWRQQIIVSIDHLPLSCIMQTNFRLLEEMYRASCSNKQLAVVVHKCVINNDELDRHTWHTSEKLSLPAYSETMLGYFQVVATTILHQD